MTSRINQVFFDILSVAVKSTANSDVPNWNFATIHLQNARLMRDEQTGKHRQTDNEYRQADGQMVSIILYMICNLQGDEKEVQQMLINSSCFWVRLEVTMLDNESKRYHNICEHVKWGDLLVGPPGSLPPPPHTPLLGCLMCWQWAKCLPCMHLQRLFYMLPHRGRGCRSLFLSLLVTVY